MAGNVSGLHVFAADTGPEALSLLDGNFNPLTTALNTLANYTNSYIDSGAVNALVVTVAAPQVFSYSDGIVLQVKVAATNTTTTPTINVNGLGLKTIVNADGSALVAGQLVLGAWATLQYNATGGVFMLVGGSGLVVPRFTVGPPSAGGTLVVNALQGQAAINLNGPNTGAGWNINFFDQTNGAFRGFIGIGTGTVGGAAVTDFGISPGAGGSVVIGTANGGAISARFGPGGNITANTPTSGTTLTLNGITGNQSLTATDGTHNFGLFLTASVGQEVQVGATSNHGLLLFTNNTSRVAINPTGNVTVNAPSSGATVTINGIAGSNQFATSDTTIGGFWGTIAATKLIVGTSTNHGLSLYTNNGERIAISNAGVVSLPSATQPAFYATENASQVLTAGATTTLAFNTAQFNQGSNYSTGTNTFTAPVAGLYLFTCMLWLQNNTAGAATINCWFQVNAGTTGTNQIIPIGYTINASSQQTIYPGSVVLKLAASDTVKIQGTVATNNIQHGTAGANQSSFCGYLLG